MPVTVGGRGKHGRPNPCVTNFSGLNSPFKFQQTFGGDFIYKNGDLLFI